MTTGSSRISKREQRRAERRRSNLVWNIILLGGGALVILGIALYVWATSRPGPLPGEQVIADEGIGTVNSTAGLTLTYNHYPPSSGTYYGDRIQAWGITTETLPEPVYLNNLARGGVVLLYHCPQACPELEQQFRDLLEAAPPDDSFNQVKILVMPYPADLMPSPIVALAWGHQLNLEQFDRALLLRWYQRFVNQGPRLEP